MKRPKVALIRGKFLNKFDMQTFEVLRQKYDITAFGSLNPFHKKFMFQTKLLPGPVDLPEFPKKMSILNRLFVDAHYLFGLENKLQGFDIAHTAETYYHYTTQALHAKEKGYVKKVIATVAENIAFNNEGIRGRKKIKRHAIDNLDHIIAISQMAKNALMKEGASEKKITVIGHGIDTKRFSPDKNHWEKLGEKKKNVTILFVGRLEMYKGIFDIVKVATSLQEDTSLKTFHLKYYFVGNGSQKKNLERKIQNAHIDGSIHESTYEAIPNWYKKADIFIAPSRKDRYWMEQYGIMLLEAQAMGLPIITTDSGSIKENVGNAAIFCKEGNIKELTNAMKKLILTPTLRVNMGKKARQRAEKMHDIHIVAKKIENVYQSVLHI